MLRPTKHSHPDRTVVYVALRLLARLRTDRLVDYAGLRKCAKTAVAGGHLLFLPALSFLYLLGLVDYRPKTDAVEYVGPR